MQIDCMRTHSSLFLISRHTLPILWWCVFPCAVSAQQTQQVDTTKVYRIPEVIVNERYREAEVRATAPLQMLSSKQIEALNVLQVSDAVKYFSGVTVKDYGGIGGLKTVSVRGLGANHTAVTYDGITLSDVQTGQLDLGRFSLDHVDMLSLNNGQSDNIFQPARSFASASVLNIRTLAPQFTEKKNLNGKVSMKAGSFGLLNPSLWLESKINPKLSASFSTEWLTADGKYPYVLEYSNQENGFTSRETRQNTDVHNLRLEAALYAALSENESAYLKTYFYQSERGLPGATVFYNVENFSSQRIWDHTFFTQAHYEKEFSKIIAFQANAKFNQGYLHYLDPTYLSSDGKLENSYRQQEYYGSASVLYRAYKNLSFSASSDISLANMTADIVEFSRPSRLTGLSVLAAKYVSNRLLFTASVLGTVINETTKTLVAARNYQKLTPYISLSVKPLEKTDLRFRIFYKEIFRLPTFNDLYYPRIGSTNLKPENTRQLNLGCTYAVVPGGIVPLFTITIDAYHNNITDKIIALPTKNTFVWSMLNMGKVTVDGLDLTAETTIYPWKKIGIVLGTCYTYQRALNMTDPADGSYQHQLPYTPRVSGSGKAAIETPWINLSYSLLWSGHRYSGFQNYVENRLPGYVDHSVSVARTFKLRDKLLSCSFEVLNLSDKNYAIIAYFPMPGRSFRATVSLKF